MAKKSYFELLKDPRWQRRRLEILQRSDFECEGCCSTEKTLHVHHKIYRKGAMPWEYEDFELQALCEDCHASEHAQRESLNEAVALLGPHEMDILIGFAEALAAQADCILKVRLRNAEHAIGVSACFWPSSEFDVIDLLNPDGGNTVNLEALQDLSRRRRALLASKDGHVQQ